MTFWEAIVLIVKYAPTVISAIMRGVDIMETMAALKRFDEAKQKAHDTKDTSDLEKILNPPSDPGSH